jgi:hypothetical protein
MRNSTAKLELASFLFRSWSAHQMLAHWQANGVASVSKIILLAVCDSNGK